jgi:hypothetical protein
MYASNGYSRSGQTLGVLEMDYMILNLSLLRHVYAADVIAESQRSLWLGCWRRRRNLSFSGMSCSQ